MTKRIDEEQVDKVFEIQASTGFSVVSWLNLIVFRMETGKILFTMIDALLVQFHNFSLFGIKSFPSASLRSYKEV